MALTQEQRKAAGTDFYIKFLGLKVAFFVNYLMLLMVDASILSTLMLVRRFINFGMWVISYLAVSQSNSGEPITVNRASMTF